MLVREYRKKDLDSVIKVHIDAWNSTYKGISNERHEFMKQYLEVFYNE